MAAEISSLHENNDSLKMLLSRRQTKRKFEFGSSLRKPVDKSGKFIMETSDLPPCCTSTDVEGTEIQKFFANSNVLITGSTGFMGKMLTEKLLVSCPKIQNLYLLIREKKGKSSQERFDELFSDDIFTRLHQLVPNFRNKVKAINGDCSRVQLGLSAQDYELLTHNVNIIFHGAATVRFDEKLKTAVNINVRSVKEMIELAKQCKNLKSMVHVSSAYSNCHILNSPIQEDFYPSTVDYEALLKYTEKTSEEEMERMISNIIEPWPNTYSFTKQLAESVIKRTGCGLPICLFRPAMIIATYKEPVQGWSDNIYGPTAVIVGVGTGILRVAYCDLDHSANLVPVDLTINGLIAAVWKTSVDFMNGKRDITIYNYISCTRNPVSWGEFIQWNRTYGVEYPTIRAVWYECFHQKKSILSYMLFFFFLHTIPGLLADIALVTMRKRPTVSKIYKKIYKFHTTFRYFSKNVFYFSDENTVDLWRNLSKEDREIYPFDIEDLNWDKYAYGHLLGLRVYLLKDGVDSLPQARRRWYKLRILHRTVQLALLGLVTWCLAELSMWLIVQLQ